MAHNPPLRFLLLVVGASVLAADATAVTLGRARGAVLIGRPLELAIGVTPDAPGGDVPCLAGEAFYGDRRIQPPPSVRIEAAPGRDPVIRFSSPAPVDEPMVTIYVRAGCGQGFTKRFVLLSELPPENEPMAPLVTQPRAAPSLAPLAPSAAATDPVAGSRGVEGEPLPTLRASRPSAAAEARARRAAQPPRASATEPGAAPGTAVPPVARAAREAPPAVSMSPRLTPRLGAATPRGGPRNRLRLEPLDLLAETSPTLRLSNQITLPANPDGDPQARAKAQALWQSIMRPPEEIAQDNLRLQSIETEMKSLREATKQNAATLDIMRQQVEKARSERNQVTMIALALGALLFGAGAWLAWRWRGERRRGSERWYTGGEVESDLADLDSRQAAPAKTPAKQPLSTPSQLDVVSRPADVPRSSFRPDITSPIRVPEPPPAPRGRAAESDSAFDFQASQGGSIRMVRVDELIDVEDKAHFFMSIGEQDQAVAVLESHVHDHVETSALAWLDLLDLYHSLNKRAEFDRLRSEFRQQFNAQVPEFDEFDKQTGGLEDYGRALSRIVALWPSPRVLEVIEESVFRRPGVGGADAFSLEAYRDLILLYNIARDVIPQEQGDDDESGGAFTSTSIQPLAPWAAPEPSEEAFDPRLVPPISRNIGIDIDLDAPTPANDEPTVVLPPRGAAPSPAGAPEPMISSFGALDFDTSFDDIDPPKVIKKSK